MRKNFTQKFLTIFVFLTVYAFGFKAYAQPAPADCDIDNGGRIAVGSGVDGRDTVCPGADAPLIRGSQQNAVSDTGTGQGGGPLITYQWQYRNASTGGVFRNVDASVLDSDPNNCNNPRNCTGNGPNFNPGFLYQTTDFVRIRYSGSAISPQNCFKVSNVVTIYAQDFYKPTISVCVSSFTVNNNAGSCFANVTLPRPGNFGRVASQDPNGVFATDNCTSNTANPPSRPRDSLRLSYRGISPNGTPFTVVNADRSYAFAIGTSQVFAIVTDSSGNFEECPFTVTVNDTSKPVYGGPRLLTRFTEQFLCTANITGSESSPNYQDCSPVTIAYQIFDSTANNGRVLTTSNNVNPGPYTGTTTNNIGDRQFRRGTYYVTYQATDSYGNVSGVPTQRDTLIIRVLDNIKPIVTAPTRDTFTTANGCRLTVGDQTTGGTFTNNGNTFAGPLSGTCVGQAGSNTTNLCTNATSTDNCQIMTEQVYGPNDFTKLFNTSGTGWDNRYFNIGRNRLAYVATDSSGNKSDTAYQEVYVRDVTRPQVFCQANETLNTSGDARVTRQGSSFAPCSYRVSNLTNTFNDNCSVTKVRYQFVQAGTVYFDTTVTTSGSTGSYTVNGPFRIGQTIVKSVAFDTTGIATGGTGQAGGNAAPFAGNNASDTCSFVVTLNDNTAPVFASCGNFTLQLNNSGTGTLTPANLGGAEDCAAITYTLSKSTFDCSNMGANTVTLTATDASGNTSTCTRTVTVVSSIVVTTTTTGEFCTNSGSITATATGGSGSYTYDIVSGPSDNTTGDADGSYNNLATGNYVVRVTDALGCFTTANVTVGSSQKNTTDLAVVALLAPGQNQEFTSVGTFKDVNVTVFERGGFSADSGAVFIPREEGYTYSLNAGGDAAMWTVDNSNPFVYIIRKNQVSGVAFACGSQSTISVRITRGAGATNTGNFSITFGLFPPSEESSEYQYNNSYSRPFTAR